MIISSLDIIKFSIPQSEGTDFLSALKTELNRWRFRKINPDRLVTIAERFGFKCTDSVVDMMYFEKGNITVTVDRSTKELTIDGVDQSTYGVLIPCNGMPFVYLYDDGKPTYLPYESYQDNIVGCYRNDISNNEMFSMRACNHFFNPDIYDGLADKPSNLDKAASMPGNVGLNYIYIMFSALGIKLPKHYATKGADEEFLKSGAFGFRRVDDEI